MDKNHETEVEEVLDLPEIAEGEEDTTDWKAEAKKLQEKAIKQRERTKELKAKLKEQTPAEKKAEAKLENKPSGELDSGQIALLRVDGIKGTEELALVKEYLASGKELLDVMENKHFINDLADLREAKASKDAIPSGTKRSAPVTRDNVEFWANKPFDEVPSEMKQKVLNAKLKSQGEGGKFYNS